jgi:hypothetical protein
MDMVFSSFRRCSNVFGRVQFVFLASIWSHVNVALVLRLRRDDPVSPR